MNRSRVFLWVAVVVVVLAGGYLAFRSKSRKEERITERAPTKIGVFNPSSATWLLDLNGNGIWDGADQDRQVSFGSPKDIPVVGDWDGSGRKKIGVFSPATATWLLDMNGNGAWDGPSVDRVVQWGSPNDVPVVGNWDGAGSQDKIGVFSPDKGTWLLDFNGNFTWDGDTVDRAVSWGSAGDIPVVGNWSGGTSVKIGVFSPKSATWLLDLDGDFRYDPAKDRLVSWGAPGNTPVVGDWNGSGTAKIGVFDPETATWVLDMNGNGVWDADTDKTVRWGSPRDRPVVGDWSGPGSTKIGVFNPNQGVWVLDMNGDFTYQADVDRASNFGSPNDTPVVGQW